MHYLSLYLDQRLRVPFNKKLKSFFCNIPTSVFNQDDMIHSYKLVYPNCLHASTAIRCSCYLSFFLNTSFFRFSIITGVPGNGYQFFLWGWLDGGFTQLGLKRPSHGKLKLANSCWQTQVGVCDHKNRWQTRLQTVGVKQKRVCQLFLCRSHTPT